MNKKMRLLTEPPANSLNTVTYEPENAVFNNDASSILTIQKPLPKDKAVRKLTIECDGLCEPPPNGIGCWSFIVFDSDRNIIHQASGYIGYGKGVTGHVAQYFAVIEALKWVGRLPAVYEVEILTDSQLVVKQVNGEWDCHTPHLQRLLDMVRELVYTTTATLDWIPSAKNQVANALSRLEHKKALRKYKGGAND